MLLINRLEAGSKPTEFDKKVVQLTGTRILKEFAEEVIGITGILTDDIALRVHRSALVYGQPQITA